MAAPLVGRRYSDFVNTSQELLARRRSSRTNLVDWLGVGDLITVATEQLVAPVEGMHRAISGRWFGLAEARVGREIRVVDGLATSVYRTIRLGGLAVGSTISVTSELASDHVALPPVWETAKGRYVQSIFNAVWGDKLENDESPLGIELGLRELNGSPVPITRASLRRAFPNPTGRLVVMLHGLGETEHCWRSEDDTTLAAGLQADGFTPLGLRYNSGRPVADNGSDLADLLEAVRTEWPVSVDEVVLIGHSMGGLVAQNAVVGAQSSGHRWVGLVTHLVAIGAPHLGSTVEKGVHGLSEGLKLFEETRPLAYFLESRSAGIKDLRYGVNDRPDGVQYHVIAGVVTREPNHPLGVLVGDLVVRVNSAIGRRREEQSPSSNVLVIGGQNHANLCHDPEVISHTRRWLASSL
jgi:pimeloyl-ACP methyl ester carboxylesterase